MAQSYFAILGISFDADAEEVKNAYRRLAKRYHPDREGGDSRKFREVQEAYTVLIDPEERRRPHREQARAEPLRRERGEFADISARPGRRSRFDSISEIEELFDRLFRDFF